MRPGTLQVCGIDVHAYRTGHPDGSACALFCSSPLVPNPPPSSLVFLLLFPLLQHGPVLQVGRGDGTMERGLAAAYADRRSCVLTLRVSAARPRHQNAADRMIKGIK